MTAFFRLGLTLLVSIMPAQLAAQVLTGTVRDLRTGAALAAADVSLLRGDSIAARVATDDSGRFRLRVTGTRPYRIRVERLGYAAHTIQVPFLDAGVIELEPSALPMSALVADTAMRWWWGSWQVTERGMIPRRNYGTDCYYLTMDGVVIHDRRLFDPDERDRHQPARALTSSSLHEILDSPAQVGDVRMRDEVWPCGTVRVTFIRDSAYARLPRRRGWDRDLIFQRGPPAPDAPLASLRETASVVLPRDWGASEIRVRRSAERTIVLASAERDSLLEVEVAESGQTLATNVGPRPQIAPWAYPESDLFPPLRLASNQWLLNQRVPNSVPQLRPHGPLYDRQLVIVDSAGGRQRVVALMRAAPDPVVLGLPWLVQPLRDHSLYVPAADGADVTILDRARDMALFWSVYRVTRVDHDGRVVFQVERPAPHIRVSDRGITAVTNALLRDPAVARAFPEERTRRSLLESSLYRPAVYYPPITDMVVGTDRTTWLRWPDNGRGSVRWDVLDPDGRPLRTLDVDATARIIAADTGGVWALFTTRGALVLKRLELRAAN